MLHLEGSGVQGEIVNTGKGTRSVGQYRFDLGGMKGEVRDFPRLKLGVYDLLYRCLEVARPEPGPSVTPVSLGIWLWPLGFKEQARPMGRVFLFGERYSLQNNGCSKAWRAGKIVTRDGVWASVHDILKASVQKRNP